MVSRVNDLDSDYKKLNKLAEAKMEILNQEFKSKIPLFEGINNLIKKYKGKTNPNIEECVSELQNLIWENRYLIWKKNMPQNHLEILKPNILFKKTLGYDYFSSGKYGVPVEKDEIVEVAGVIDQPNKLVMISDKFPSEVQNFTAAHELGHSILHEQSILHRDIPIDSIENDRSYNKIEKEADKFASFFLMPTKLLKKEFKINFLSEIFELDEGSAFNFGGKSLPDIKKECKTLRQLTRKLASSKSFSGNRFDSLSNKFGVSVEAMAIRLEELNLVKYYR